MYFIDTDTLTRAHAGQGQIADRINQVGPENVSTTVVTATEILRGRHEYLVKAADGSQLVRAQQLLDFSEQLLRDIPIVSIDTAIANTFDTMRQNKKLKKI